MTRNTIQTDPFTGSGTLGANWANLMTAVRGDVTFDGSNNRITGAFAASVNDHPMARWVGSGTFTNDQYSSIKIVGLSILSTTNRVGVLVRASSATGANAQAYEGYIYLDGSGTYTTVLAMRNAATYTTLNSGTLAWANNDLLSLEAEGTTIRLCKNGVALGGGWTVTDSTHSTGAPGIICTQAAYGDDWEGGSITAGSGATGVTLSGPTSGNVGVASSAFTVGVTPGGSTITGTLVVTPNDSSGGGTFTPTSVSLTTGSPTATFTYTPASAGAKTIAVTDDGGLTDPSSITYTASSTGATAITLTGPSTGTAGSESTNFTVGANGVITGTVTVTPTATGCTFTPASVNISSGSPTATFTCNAATVGVKSITLTNSGGLSNPSAFTYTANTAGSFSASFGPGYYSTNTGPQVSKAATWSVFPGGQPGALAGITPVDGSGTSDSNGIWTATGIPIAGPAIVIAKDADGGVYYEPVTVA